MDSHDVLQVIESLEQFYTAIFEGAGNRTAMLLLRTLQTKAGFLRALTFQQQQESNTRRSSAHIKQIAAAIKARDAEAAAQACIAQVERSSKVAMRFLGNSGVGADAKTERAA